MLYMFTIIYNILYEVYIILVQVLSLRPEPDTNFDTMSILIGVRFLFAFSPTTHFNERSRGVHFRQNEVTPKKLDNFYSEILSNFWGSLHTWCLLLYFCTNRPIQSVISVSGSVQQQERYHKYQGKCTA